MSRIGKNSVSIPKGVECSIEGSCFKVKGQLGTLNINLSSDINLEIIDENILIRPISETKKARMMWGTTRNLVNNMIKGSSVGFSKRLEINGVGYKASIQDKNLILQLGFSHDINFFIPQDVKITVEKPTTVLISGADKQRVGQIAAEIQSYRPPEPYKGKGIKYEHQVILRKEGKKK